MPNKPNTPPIPAQEEGNKLASPSNKVHEAKPAMVVTKGTVVSSGEKIKEVKKLDMDKRDGSSSGGAGSAK
ncbi:MAG: hypothetical protein MMC23_009217 [Stictis urceolatum]|nr:hypothetical protein [Stictis urceolata]